jgi:hypothetical protein
MSSIFGKTKGFGRRGSGGTVAQRREIRRQMVRAIVKKLKAEGKTINLQAINKDVLAKCKRRHQKRGPAKTG